MKQEISVAATYILSLLQRNDLSLQQQTQFKLALLSNLTTKYNGHWYEAQPAKAQAFRSLMLDAENNFIESIVLDAANRANIPNACKRFNTVNGGLRIWVDPGEVVIGSIRGKGSNVTTTIFKREKQLQQQQTAQFTSAPNMLTKSKPTRATSPTKPQRVGGTVYYSNSANCWSEFKKPNYQPWPVNNTCKNATASSTYSTTKSNNYPYQLMNMYKREQTRVY